MNEPMLEMYIYETTQQLELLEQAIIANEKNKVYSGDMLNEIFRYIHTIKGSSAMMLFNNIATLAHSIEDIFYYLRETRPEKTDYSSLFDLVLEGIDFIKIEITKLKDGEPVDGDAVAIIEKLNHFLSFLKKDITEEDLPDTIVKPEIQKYYVSKDQIRNKQGLNKFKATIQFQDDCEMENIRCYTVIHNLMDMADEVYFLPHDIIENHDTSLWIRENGFEIYIRTEHDYEVMHHFFMQTIFLKSLELIELKNEDAFQPFYNEKNQEMQNQSEKLTTIEQSLQSKRSIKDIALTGLSVISVKVDKLDNLMDLVGEMVIAESMVTQNPEINNIYAENFHKAARQLHKITNELQDMVMAIRMVPLSSTFQKTQRILRDMCKKLGKEVSLEIIGEETEVDKNIIENISDPLMHLIRNAIDHGIEVAEERRLKGKNVVGKVILEAKNSGGDVLVIIKDDGKGLNKDKLLEKARNNGLLVKSESEMTDQDIYNLILIPGFSTKEGVTEFSGRGVGMDVVAKNLNAIGGSIEVDSIEEQYTQITLRIPLTLAIIDGMNIRVGNSRYTIPIIAIKESFRPKQSDILEDPDGNEMIMVRGVCYPILRLHKYFNVSFPRCNNFSDGIFIMVEHGSYTFCLFADELMGQQQVVVKSLPSYIKSKRMLNGIGGCTLLGDGSISLILDIGGLAFI